MKQNLKVFIIEDKDKTKEPHESSLKLMGYKNIALCKNLEEFMKIVPYSNIDVVLVDSVDREKEAKQLVSDKNKRKDMEKTRIIVLVGDSHSKEEWMDKVDICLKKPHPIRKFVEALEKAEDGLWCREQRLFRRYKNHNALEVIPNSPTKERIPEVSLSGMSLESKSSLNVGDNLTFKAKEWGSRDPISITGKVMWKRKKDDFYTYGIRFKDLQTPSNTN